MENQPEDNSGSKMPGTPLREHGARLFLTAYRTCQGVLMRGFGNKSCQRRYN
ncbi:hypothetical protein L208DRAFT_1398187 [Tricholoma matsutake]|nr:hypothetical protein L208DRAFT_1398187 [Tricholoma matsutake 945]